VRLRSDFSASLFSFRLAYFSLLFFQPPDKNLFVCFTRPTDVFGESTFSTPPLHISASPFVSATHAVSFIASLFDHPLLFVFFPFPQLFRRAFEGLGFFRTIPGFRLAPSQFALASTKDGLFRVIVPPPSGSF